MTRLKTVIWPYAPPAKPNSAELTFAAKRRAAEIIAGLEREGVAVTLKDDRLRVTATGRPSGAALLEVERRADHIEAHLRTVHDEDAPPAWHTTLRRRDLRCWRLIVDKGGIVSRATPTPMSFDKRYRWTPKQDGTEAGPVRRKDCRPNGCSPKPSNRNRPPHFRELHALNSQQHVAQIEAAIGADLGALEWAEGARKRDLHVIA